MIACRCLKRARRKLPRKKEEEVTGKRIIVSVLLSLILVPTAAMAQFEAVPDQDSESGSFFDDVIWIVDAGLSMPVGDKSDFYNSGFVIGFNMFYPWSERFHYGGRIAFNKWGVDDGGWTGNDIDGSSLIIEFVPMARYLFPNDDASTTTFFAQAGLGFYRFSWDVDVTDAADITHNHDGSDVNLGLCFGGGMILEKGNREWIVQPMLNQVFTDGDSSTYLSITIGMAF